MNKRIYRNFLLISLTYYLVIYMLGIIGIMPFYYNAYVDITVFCIMFFPFLWIYRKDNLLCFEIMAFPVAFLGLFYDDIIYPLVPELLRFYEVSEMSIKAKSETLQMIALIIFLLGSTLGDSEGEKYAANNKLINDNIDYKQISYVLSFILLFLIVLDYYKGVFSTWFYYSNSDLIDREARNQGLGHITCLCLANSCVEITRLRSLNVDSLKAFFKNVNKIYIVEWMLISILLAVSGNRNEMLLILLPLIVGYTIFIQKISNIQLLIVLVGGVFLMSIVGSTRQGLASLSDYESSLYNLTRDFSALGYNADYLVGYTDNNGMVYFGPTIRTLFSGIPLFGTYILKLFDSSNIPMASSQLTTISVNSNSGLGTSLIGDLYYTAGFIWVILFMFVFGRIMSKLYRNVHNSNIYWFIFYSFMVANAVYFIRSNWLLPITQLEYTMIIVLLCQSLFRTKK